MSTVKPPKLSAVANKIEYIKLRGKPARLGNLNVVVSYYSTETRQGSYERGFKWSTSDWAMLKRKARVKREIRRNGRLIRKYTIEITLYSCDHGVTWHESSKDARKSKGKLKLTGDLRCEMAFHNIQTINRQYDSNYRWHR